nr:MAG TPA: hypothetical protein [Bacteriophage sp.]DAP60183.1 MAG TPA: hypothetical protein [Caudoviricetes sp.]
MFVYYVRCAINRPPVLSTPFIRGMLQPGASSFFRS